MSVKCKLTGHSWGDVEKELQAGENDGVEKIVEKESCERCEAEKIVSEHTSISSDVAEEEVEEDNEKLVGERITNENKSNSGHNTKNMDLPEDYKAEEDKGVELLETDSSSEENTEEADDTSHPASEHTETPTEADSYFTEEETSTSPSADDSDGAHVMHLSEESAMTETVEEQEGVTCPNCSFSESEESGYMAGDSCPECFEAYLKSSESKN